MGYLIKIFDRIIKYRDRNEVMVFSIEIVVFNNVVPFLSGFREL